MVSNPFTDPDWAERVTQFIADWTEKIRARTTQPLIYLARAIVFGVIATIGVIASVTLLLIGIMRLVIPSSGNVPEDEALHKEHRRLSAGEVVREEIAP